MNQSGMTKEPPSLNCKQTLNSSDMFTKHKFDQISSLAKLSVVLPHANYRIPNYLINFLSTNVQLQFKFKEISQPRRSSANHG